MTITTDISRSSRWTADGYNRTWSYPFKALSSDNMVLLVTDNAGFETSVISGFQANNLGQDGGGTIVYPLEPAQPLPAGYTVVVMRRTPRQQPFQIGAQGRFFPETHEKALDNLEMQIQELSLSVDRSVRDTSDVNTMERMNTDAILRPSGRSMMFVTLV